MTHGEQGWGNAPTQGPQPAAEPPLLALAPLLLTFAAITLVMILGGVSQSLLISLLQKEIPDLYDPLTFASTAWCGCAMLLDLLGGMVYAFIYKRSHPLSRANAAAGGAVAGAAARFVITILSGPLYALLSLLFSNFLFEIAPLSGMGSLTSGGGALTLLNIYLWTLHGAAAGALGGLLGSLLWKPK